MNDRSHAAPDDADRLLPQVYDELRRIAQQRLSRERAGQTLQATALVHEAYLRLVGPEGAGAEGWQGRTHFFGAAAEAMRRILVDRARARGAAKRGGDRQRLGLETSCLQMAEEAPTDLLDLDEALGRLTAQDPQKAELVKLRFFAGLTMPETARALDVSLATAHRHWAFARAWLISAMQGKV